MKPLPVILITAGPTREYLDPVRFISNDSSGKMGVALARAAARKGCRVILVAGPSDLPAIRGIKSFPVVSAREMFAAVKKNFPGAHIVIGAAAVADYRPAKYSAHKIKKDGDKRCLRLVPNPDIIAWAGRSKGRRVVAGFALESRDLLRAAAEKMKTKKLDLIAANRPSAIGSDRSSAWLLFSDGGRICLSGLPKETIAEKIIDETIRIWKNRQTGPDAH